MKYIVLLKHSVMQQFWGPEPTIGRALTTAEQQIQFWANQKLILCWYIFGLVIMSWTKELLELNRKSVFTCHCRFRKHLHRIGLSNEIEPRPYLEDAETVKYIFGHCPATMRIKYASFRKVDPLLEDLKAIPLNKILSYLKGLNLLDGINLYIL